MKYKDFKKSINDLAKGLISIGVNKGDNVAVWAVNSPEVVISQFGISKTGGVFVPFNAYEKQKRMEELLKQSETHTLIMQVGAKGTENIELLFRICPELCESEPGKLSSK
ncbi:MAG TPA: AMP-binding protein, partial [Clostridiales bacterium]|nr:AMP-binding protein [Clostridiales bacterium]